jgi:hypothetical protein
MKISITGNVDPALATLATLPKQVRYASAVALTAAAVKVRQAEVKEMLDSFDRPTKRSLDAVYIRPATVASQQAEVGIKDNIGSGGRAPITWLRWQVYGGLRSVKAFERLLMGQGAMAAGDRAVPGRFAKLDAYGNISSGQVTQILSHLRIDSSTGSTRALPRYSFDDRGRDRRKKQRTIARAYDRAGGQFIALPQGRGKLAPGVYQTRSTAFGRTAPRPVLIFVPRARYEAGRFDFYAAGRLAAQRHLVPEFQAALAKAIGATK